MEGKMIRIGAITDERMGKQDSESIFDATGVYTAIFSKSSPIIQHPFAKGSIYYAGNDESCRIC